MRSKRVIFVLGALGIAAVFALRFPVKPSVSRSSSIAVSPDQLEQPPSTSIRSVTSAPSTVASGAASASAVASSATFLEELLQRLAAAEGEKDLIAREKWLTETIASIPASQIASIVEALWGKSLSGLGRELRLRLVRLWTQEKPELAADFILRQPESAHRTQSLGVMAAAWAERDLNGAVRWMTQLTSSGDKEGVMSQVLYEAARTAPLEAMKLAVAMPHGASRDELLTHLAVQWADKEPKAAAEWASQIQDPETRTKLLGSALVAWSEQDPSGAAHFAFESFPADDPKDETIVGMVQRWTQKDPETAARWVQEFPQGPVRDAALENLVQIWTDQDASKAGEWINSLPEGGARDTTIAAYARKLTPVDPSRAVAWAEAIGDADKRAQELEAAGMTWMHSDAEAAAVWLGGSSLSEPAKQRILASKGKGQ
jgi:hypothetical protein